MALEWLGPIVSAGASVYNAVKNNSSGIAGLVQGGLGLYGAMNPQELYSQDLIDELVSSSRLSRELAKSADRDRQIQMGARSQALGRSQQLLAAGLDPQSSTFKRIAAGEESTARKDFVDALNEYRNWSHRYGQGVVNPSRRDETMARLATRGFEDAQNKARENVRKYLMSTAEANRAVAGSYSSGGGQGIDNSGLSGALNASAGNAQAAARGRETGFANIVGGLQGISENFKSTPKTPSASAPAGGMNLALGGGPRSTYNWPGQELGNPRVS